MRVLFLAFVLSLSIANISLAETITFNDGREIRVDSCTVEGDDIFYQIAGKSYQTNFSEVSGITAAGEPEFSLQINNLTEFKEWSEQKERDYGKKETPVLPTEEAMKKFAALVNDFYNHDAAFREAAKEIAYESYHGGGRKYSQEVSFFVIPEKAHYNLVKFYKETEDLTTGLSGDAKSTVDTVYKGIAFYMVQLPGEEAIKAGWASPSDRPNGDHPEDIKKYTKGILSLYTSGKTKEEHKKEIGALWDRMRTFLIKGDVEKAVSCFSSSTKDSYRKNFEALKKAGELKKMADGLKDMKVYEIKYGMAQGDIRTKENGKELSYYVQFVIEDEGNWKIKSF